MTAHPFDLSGKVAVVTGASRGLGQYLGRALAKAGADLVISSRCLPNLRPFQVEMEDLGRQVFAVDWIFAIRTAFALPQRRQPPTFRRSTSWSTTRAATFAS